MAKRGLITAHPGARKFYEKLGDDVANELVEWFNLVDATYRSELRELNETNYARFEAKLEQRIAELSLRVDSKFAEQNTRFAELREFLERRIGGQTRWLYAAWAVQLAATVAVLLRLFLR